MCDTCGAIEELGQRFRMCGGCMTTQVRTYQLQQLYYITDNDLPTVLLTRMPKAPLAIA